MGDLSDAKPLKPSFPFAKARNSSSNEIAL